MIYSFDTEHAKQYGVNEAIMLHNILFWLATNKANNQNIHDGKVWMFNSASAFLKLFPFWSEHKIRRILVSLKDQGAIEFGNYNKVGYDKTKWYSSPLLDSYCKSATSMSQNCRIDVTELQNRIDGIAEPIPDSKPDSKPDKGFGLDCMNHDEVVANREKQKQWAISEGLIKG